MRNNNPWVLITGAEGGIGKALVRSFADNGYNVIATDITGLGSTHPNIVWLQLDLEQFAKSETYADSFLNQVIKATEHKGINALINNAATQILGSCEEVTRNQWNSSFQVNLSAPFFLVQLFLKDLEKNQGSVVNISSIHAVQTKKGFVTYATTKSALSSLTRNLAVDLGKKVRVNAIEPAAVSTQMLKDGFVGKEEKYKQLESFHPLARIATPSEIANLALFLCSDQSSFIHGACISATGGIHACLNDPA